MKKRLESAAKRRKAFLPWLLVANALLLGAILIVLLPRAFGPAASAATPSPVPAPFTTAPETPAADGSLTTAPTRTQPKTTDAAIPETEAVPRIIELHDKSRTVSGNIAAGAYSFALKADGTVLQAGFCEPFGGMDASGWRDIAAISAKDAHVVGLYPDGTVVAAGAQSELGEDYYGVGSWKDVVAVSAGFSGLTLGLKADGTVYSCGTIPDDPELTDISDWNDIVAIAAGSYFAIGLKSDGTAVAAGDNSRGQCDVGGWRDIIGIAAGHDYAVGLRCDGTVVTAGQDGAYEPYVSSWKDIVEISAGQSCMAGLMADGTVVAATAGGPLSCVAEWSDIIAIAAGTSHVIGLKADGTLAAAGENPFGQCETGSWNGLAAEPLSGSNSKKTWEELQAGAYYRLFLDLYDADKSLNHEIKYLAVDMTGVKLKDASVLEKMFKDFCYRKSLTLLLSDYDRLKKEGYISDPLYFKDGILISFKDTIVSASGHTLIVDASKWKGGVAAVGGIYKLTNYGVMWKVTCLDGWIS